MIKYVQGDLFDVTEGVIAHGVNCQSKFGSGVAKTMLEKYPVVKENYHGLCEHYKLLNFGTGLLLGMVQPVKVSDKLTILNCFTQDKYGYDGKQYIDYDAIEQCMNEIKRKYLDKGKIVAMPKIGSGLGGGDWTKIEEIINKVTGDSEILIYVK
jgi:O-acetyl-ADP-ribose deacetylase (regulator of RNase III)